jgi:chloramphenicol-sensitive protein RarD
MPDHNSSMADAPQPCRRREARNGVLFAAGGYAMWGVTPLFWKLLEDVPAFEVLLHRIVWSVPFLAVWLLVRGRFFSAFIAVANLKTLAMMMTSALLVSVNWGVFIWAVENNRIMDASFGYYINPLANVLIGYFLLSERLSRGQVIAIVLAVVAIAVQIWNLGSLPWLSLTLAVSFSFYGFFKKKTAKAGAAQGLFIEVLLVTPFALGALYYLQLQGQNSFSFETPNTAVLLIFAGLITVVPLALFAAGARRIQLITIGLLQYIGPSLNFLIAIFIFNEVAQPLQLFSFALIWVGLAIFSYDTYARDV